MEVTNLASLMTRKRNKLENNHLPGLTLCCDLEKKPYWHQQSNFPVLSSQGVDYTVLNIVWVAEVQNSLHWSYSSRIQTQLEKQKHRVVVGIQYGITVTTVQNCQSEGVAKQGYSMPAADFMIFKAPFTTGAKKLFRKLESMAESHMFFPNWQFL